MISCSTMEWHRWANKSIHILFWPKLWVSYLPYLILCIFLCFYIIKCCIFCVLFWHPLEYFPEKQDLFEKCSIPYDCCPSRLNFNWLTMYCCHSEIYVRGKKYRCCSHVFFLSSYLLYFLDYAHTCKYDNCNFLESWSWKT